jgi:uncharacterized protein (TIGR03663 family)
MTRSRTAWTFATIVALAAVLRFPSLNLRPMHADEAVHAAKMGTLLEQGSYQYDPAEYHGPTLNYLTLVAARVRGAARYQELDEVTLRIVPAVGGVAMVAAHILLVPVIGVGAAATAALLAALSPAFVFYNRYYIHETLLVAFSFGAIVALWRYLRNPRMAWAVAAGACSGLMCATKETWVIAFGCIMVALLLTRAAGRWHGGVLTVGKSGSRGRHLLAGLVTAVVVSSLLFSSFLSNPRGIVDAVTAYPGYLERAAGPTSWHVHPWHYYLGLLLYSRPAGGPVWTEAAVVAFALIGLVAAARPNRDPARADRGFDLFVSSYAVLMAAGYSAIPYKTPWCLLGFLHGLILLAGIGVARVVGAAPTTHVRIVVAAIVAAASVHLGWQAWVASFRYPADPRNPYVYGHTGVGVFEIARRVEGLALAHPLRFAMPVEIVSRENLWPLPWYFRRFSDVRWASAPPEDTTSAPVILLTPDVEGAVARKLYELRSPGERELYVNIFDQPVDLRPDVEVRGYAAKTLWDDYEQRRE